jgi:hypothetical protein
MSPVTRARFDTLHEAPLELETREMRIWMNNAVYWIEYPKKEDSGKELMAVFINLSRVNHDCVPTTTACRMRRFIRTALKSVCILPLLGLFELAKKSLCFMMKASIT